MIIVLFCRASYSSLTSDFSFFRFDISECQVNQMPDHFCVVSD